MQAQPYFPRPKASAALHRMRALRSAVIGVLAGMVTVGCTHSAQTEVKVQVTANGAVEYIHHKPDSGASARMILAHGFLRTPGTMEHLAKAFAARGIETANIKLRRSKPWNGNHTENARDMIALRESLGWQKVIYAGFSAGGLSALLAAAEDTACVKLLLLDPVDHGMLGTENAPKVRIPTLIILGQPGAGNANRNATAMLGALPNGETFELPEATHCDFEASPSALCHLLTGRKPDRTDSAHSSIILHSTAFLANQPANP